jgi:lysyl-tRNA synthetase class 2
LDPLGKKLIFADLTSQSEKIQLKVSQSKENQDKIKDFAELLDKGDVVGIKGVVCRTNSGELSIEVNDFALLSKCLNPLPNELTNEEERFRKRCLDLIVNNQNRKILIQRFQIINSIREFLNQQGFIEIETPILVYSASGALAKPFTTYHNKLRRNFYLRIATEIPLKMLLVGGFEKVYEIGRIFRNEGIDARHNPEFTTIEVYHAYENAEHMMSLTEELLHYLTKEVIKKEKFEFKKDKGVSYVINLQPPFRKMTMIEAIKEYENIDFTDVNNKEKALELVKKYPLELKPYQNTVGHIINTFFEKFIEKKLIQPTFVYDYPIETSPLAKSKENNPL